VQIADEAVYSIAAIGCSAMFCARVKRERLHQEHGALRVEMLACIARDTDRVAHVVEAIEEADQVECAVVTLRRRHLERGLCSDPASTARARDVSIDGE
jgi:cobalamin biosynthesis protein CbiD